MAATGTAADAGYALDAFTKVNTSIGNVKRIANSAVQSIKINVSWGAKQFPTYITVRDSERLDRATDAATMKCTGPAAGDAAFTGHVKPLFERVRR